MRKLLVSLFLLAMSGLAVADHPKVEITPFLAYRAGGEIEANDNALFNEDVDVDESDAFGVVVGIPISPSLQIELLYSKQETELIDNDDLFGPAVGLVDVDVTYYHVGVMWQWNLKHATPFVTGSLGLGRVDPSGAGIGDDRFSGSIGGGVKLMVTPHVGFRFEGRSFWTNTDNDDEFFNDFDDYDGFNDLVQAEFKVGLVLSF